MFQIFTSVKCFVADRCDALFNNHLFNLFIIGIDFLHGALTGDGQGSFFQ